MLVTTLIITSICAFVGIFQALQTVDNISATLARILVPTISTPSKTLRISSPASRLTLDSVAAVWLPGTWTTSLRLATDSHSFGRETHHLPRKISQTTASRTIPGVHESAHQHACLWTAGVVVLSVILTLCTAFSASTSHNKSDMVGRDAEHAVLLYHPEVRPSAAVGLDHPKNPLTWQITPATLCATVTPAYSHVPPCNDVHTDRQVFGVDVPVQVLERNTTDLDEFDDGTYLRDTLGLIDWSDVPPQRGYWPTLDEDVSSAEHESRSCTTPCPWYVSEEDLRGWVFPAGPVRPDRSEPVELLVAGEG